jgi:hypothetical protein
MNEIFPLGNRGLPMDLCSRALGGQMGNRMRIGIRVKISFHSCEMPGQIRKNTCRLFKIIF